jgi:hypothetical protein
MDFANLSPEDKAQLILQLVGGGENHPDEQQDQAMIDQEVKPALEMLMERLNALESIVEKIVMGAYGAVQNREKSSLLGSIKEKYAGDIDGISPIYSKLVGSDPYEDLVGELMKRREGEGFTPEAEEGTIQELLSGLKSKFGGLKIAEETPPVEEVTVEKTEAPAEEKAPSGPDENYKKKMAAMRAAFGR